MAERILEKLYELKRFNNEMYAEFNQVARRCYERGYYDDLEYWNERMITILEEIDRIKQDIKTLEGKRL